MSIDDATPDEGNKASEKAYDRGFITGVPKEWDIVNKPPHYNKGGIEFIDAIEAMLTPEEFIGYLRGNALKYRWRMRYKGKVLQDMKKADWYDNKLLEYIEKNPDVLG